jgi:hypothetical protein
MMTTDRPELTTENAATSKVPGVARKAKRSVVKLLAKKSVVATKSEKKKPKIKIVRDFSMPQVEYQKIAEIKEACLKAGIHVKKSEVLRAGLKVLGEMNPEQIMRVIVGLAKTKVELHIKPATGKAVSL